jgi:hypothetical protein
VTRRSHHLPGSERMFPAQRIGGADTDHLRRPFQNPVKGPGQGQQPSQGSSGSSLRESARGRPPAP